VVCSGPKAAVFAQKQPDKYCGPFFSNRLAIKNLNFRAVQKFPFTPYLCPRLFFPAEPG
jgi:hypothetical protein